MNFINNNSNNQNQNTNHDCYLNYIEDKYILIICKFLDLNDLNNFLSTN